MVQCSDCLRFLLASQIEELRGELNKLRYEHSFLQQEYQHERTQHQQVTDEMKLRYESEVSLFVLFPSKLSQTCLFGNLLLEQENHVIECRVRLST